MLHTFHIKRNPTPALQMAMKVLLYCHQILNNCMVCDQNFLVINQIKKYCLGKIISLVKSHLNNHLTQGEVVEYFQLFSILL